MSEPTPRTFILKCKPHLTKEKKTRKYYKYDKVVYLVKIKNRSVQENSDDEDKENNDKEKGFVRDLE